MTTLVNGLRRWLDEREVASVGEVRGMIAGGEA